MSVQRQEAPRPRFTPVYRILVIDDDPGIRALCAALLAHEGYDVLEAGDGREGVTQALVHRPDLVLCDISMPMLDGFGVAAALRQNEQTRDVPIVFLTGETEPAAKLRACALGALGFLTKPVRPEVLASVIRAVVLDVANA